MYPSSTSSSSQGSMGPSGDALMRCGSAPSSLLTNAVDSVAGATRDFSAALAPQTTHHLAPTLFFPTQASESSSHNDAVSRNREEHGRPNSALGLHRCYGFPAAAAAEGPSASPSLVRHSSSPAGFLNHLATAAGDNGFSITRGIGGYNSKGVVGESSRGHGVARLNSQLSFTRQEGLSRIAEETESESAAAAASDGTDHHHHHAQRKSSHSYGNNGGGGFTMGSWDDNHNANPAIFSVATSKRSKPVAGNIASGTDAMESQFQFSIPQGAFEMATMEKLLHIPQDSVPCKIRAKRGCATHPRSIAERERRTRISGKLKKLQDLVPNMDKQTSYADMLDLAVQHIKGLQSQVQKLNKELESCKCGCKKSSAEHK